MVTYFRAGDKIGSRPIEAETLDTVSITSLDDDPNNGEEIPPLAVKGFELKNWVKREAIASCPEESSFINTSAPKLATRTPLTVLIESGDVVAKLAILNQFKKKGLIRISLKNKSKLT